MKATRTILVFLAATAAAGPISGPGGSGPFLATRGGSAIPKPVSAPAPARPAAVAPKPAPPAPRRFGGPLYSPYGPRMTGWTTDTHGRVNGYHVVLPAVEENPFAGMPLVTTPVAGRGTPPPPPPPPPVERVVTERVYVLPAPSAAKAEAAEAAALAEKLGDGTPTPKKVDEARFRADVLPVVRSDWRFDGSALVPAFSYEVSGASVRKTARPEAAPLPQPSVEQVMAAFGRGASFTVPRKASFSVPCGACAGTGRVAARRIVRDDGSPDRIEWGACPRCGGAGTRTLEATRLFEVSRKP